MIVTYVVIVLLLSSFPCFVAYVLIEAFYEDYDYADRANDKPEKKQKKPEKLCLRWGPTRWFFSILRFYLERRPFVLESFEQYIMILRGDPNVYWIDGKTIDERVAYVINCNIKFITQKRISIKHLRKLLIRELAKPH